MSLVLNDPAQLKVLLVDDSTTYRMILSRALKSFPRVHLCGQASDGEECLRMAEELLPHLVLLDVSMPVLDGIETLKRLRSRRSDIDVVMCSGIDVGQTGLTMQALAYGALDFISKPVGDNPAESMSALVAQLGRIVELAEHRRIQRETRRQIAENARLTANLARGFRSNLGGTGDAPARPASPDVPRSNERPSDPARPIAPERPEIRARPLPVPVAPRRELPVPAVPHRSSPGEAGNRRPPKRIDAVLVGVSTGGPNALHELVPRLPAGFPVPILCVQHMPPLFTASLAERLDRESALRVREGADGMRPEPGHFYIAPGGSHMVLTRTGDGSLRLRTTSSPPVNSCRPSVDVLFHSAEPLFGGNLLTVVLTGMGADGAEGVRGLRAKGAWSLVQDEASSVVWGMPGAVAQNGDADEILPLDRLAARMVELVAKGERP